MVVSKLALLLLSSASFAPEVTVDSIKGLERAIDRAKDGTTIYIKGGDYDLSKDKTYYRGTLRYGGFHVDKNLKFVGVEGRPNFITLDNSPVSDETAKGLFTIDPTVDHVSFENLTFSGAQNSSRNGAGIRHQGGDLTVTNVHFLGNQNGILGIADKGIEGTVTIRGSAFENNGAEDGRAHGVYIRAASLNIEETSFREGKVGHHVKSVSMRTIVRNSNFDDAQTGTSSRMIDITAGGDVVITGNVFQKSASAPNGNFIFYDEGRFDGEIGSELTIAENSFVNAHQYGSALDNKTLLEAHLTNNSFAGFERERLFSGLYSQSGNQFDDGPLKATTYRDGAVSLSENADRYFFKKTYQADKIESGLGDDMIHGGSGDDTIFGGEGHDTLLGSEGNDSLFGEAGDDLLIGGNETTGLYGGEGNDVLVDNFPGLEGEVYRGVLNGGAGDDSLHVFFNAERVVGGAGNDGIYLADSVQYGQSIYGGAGADTLIGNDKEQEIFGGDGDDLIYPGNSYDKVDAGDGIDTVIFDGPYKNFKVTPGSWQHESYRLVAPADNWPEGKAQLGEYGEEIWYAEFLQFDNGVYDIAASKFRKNQPRDPHLTMIPDVQPIRDHIETELPGLKVVRGKRPR